MPGNTRTLFVHHFICVAENYFSSHHSIKHLRHGNCHSEINGTYVRTLLIKADIDSELTHEKYAAVKKL